MPDGNRQRRKFYGRRQGRRLRPGQQRALALHLDAFAIPGVDIDANPARTPLDLPGLFGSPRPVWLEIGFGSGEHLVHLAAENESAGMLGCDPYVNGVARLVGKLVGSGIGNVRVHPGDVRDLLDVLPDGSIERAFLLYPDPWPKRRHHGRRFVNPEFLEPLRRALAAGAEFRIATDIGDYARQSLEQVASLGGFTWLAEGPEDWRQPWPGWPSTRYEQKALRAGRTPHYLVFRKDPAGTGDRGWAAGKCSREELMRQRGRT